MSHDTHHGHPTEGKPKTAFSAAFWLIVIIAGLFIAALNFIQAESVPEAEGVESEKRTEEGKLLMQEGAGHTGKKARIDQKTMSTHQYEAKDTTAHEAGH